MTDRIITNGPAIRESLSWGQPASNLLEARERAEMARRARLYSQRRTRRTIPTGAAFLESITGRRAPTSGTGLTEAKATTVKRPAWIVDEPERTRTRLTLARC